MSENLRILATLIIPWMSREFATPFKNVMQVGEISEFCCFGTYRRVSESGESHRGGYLPSHRSHVVEIRAGNYAKELWWIIIFNEQTFRGVFLAPNRNGCVTHLRWRIQSGFQSRFCVWPPENSSPSEADWRDPSLNRVGSHPLPWIFLMFRF